jgi:hypothetical protein
VPTLLCAECGETSDERAAGWRAYFTGGEGEVDGVEVFCTICAATEFDPTRMQDDEA